MSQLVHDDARMENPKVTSRIAKRSKAVGWVCVCLLATICIPHNTQVRRVLAGLLLVIASFAFLIGWFFDQSSQGNSNSPAK